MEIEVDGSFPFLDVLVWKKDVGSFSHQVFHKKTHTKQYLHANSHHFPTQELGVLNTLATLDLRVSNEIHLVNEKTHLLNVFELNGYKKYQGIRAFLKASRGPKNKK